MNIKTCSKCKEARPIYEFYKQKDGLFGVRGDCKPCFNIANKEYVAKNRLAYRRRKNLYRFKNRNKKERQLATNLVYRAKQKGELIKPKTCLCCDCERSLQAHHRDYNKPLDVMWLCSKCHGFIHGYLFIALQGEPNGRD